jgi:hypothetical protein
MEYPTAKLGKGEHRGCELTEAHDTDPELGNGYDTECELSYGNNPFCGHRDLVGPVLEGYVNERQATYDDFGSFVFKLKVWG